MGDDGAAPLRRRERTHERKSRALLVFEEARARERTAIGVNGFRPEERRRQHHLPAKYETVQRKMMSEELPPPGLARRGRAEQAERIAPFAEHRRPADE